MAQRKKPPGGDVVQLSPADRLAQIDRDIEWFDRVADDESSGATASVQAKVRACNLRDQRAALLSELEMQGRTDPEAKLEAMISLAVSNQSWVAAATMTKQLEDIRRSREEDVRRKRDEWGADLTDEQLLEILTEAARALPLPMRLRLRDSLSAVAAGG